MLYEHYSSSYFLVAAWFLWKLYKVRVKKIVYVDYLNKIIRALNSIYQYWIIPATREAISCYFTKLPGRFTVQALGSSPANSSGTGATASSITSVWARIIDTIFNWRYLESVLFDDFFIFHRIRYEKESIIVVVASIARMEPAFGIYGVSGGAFVINASLHDHRTMYANFTFLGWS